MLFLETILIAYIAIYICILGFKPKKEKKQGKTAKKLLMIANNKCMLFVSLVICTGLAVNTAFLFSSVFYLPFVIAFCVIIMVLLVISFFGETQIVALIALCVSVLGLVGGVAVKVNTDKKLELEKVSKMADSKEPNVLEVFARKQGDTKWQKNLFVNNHENIEIRIAFVNNEDVQVDNVMIRDVLQEGLTYLGNSTDLYNAMYQDGCRLDEDTVTTSGINIGSYLPNGNAEVRFWIRVEMEDAMNSNGLLSLVNASSVTISKSEDISDSVVYTDSVSISILP